MKIFKIKRNDTSPLLRVFVSDEDGNRVPLTSLNEIKFVMRDCFVYNKDTEQVKVENAQNISLLDQTLLDTKGGFEYNWAEEDTDTSGLYSAEFQITLNGVESLAYQPFALVDGQTLTLEIDQGSVQTFTFNEADFADITIATAEEIVAVINNTATDFTASVSEGYRILLQTNDIDLSGSVKVTGGSANDILRFPVEFRKNQKVSLPERGFKVEVLPDFDEN